MSQKLFFYDFFLVFQSKEVRKRIRLSSNLRKKDKQERGSASNSTTKLDEILKNLESNEDITIKEENRRKSA